MRSEGGLSLKKKKVLHKNLKVVSVKDETTLPCKRTKTRAALSTDGESYSKGGKRGKEGKEPPCTHNEGRTIWGSSRRKEAGASEAKQSLKRRVRVLKGTKVIVANGPVDVLKKQVRGRSKTKGKVEVTSDPTNPASTKGRVDGADANEEPRKRKRIIRLDPCDISNKRQLVLPSPLLTPPGSSKDKQKDHLDKDAEMSMNAQFRAIKPSPSILSFVEHNLLGRRRSIEIKRAGYNIDLSAPLDNIPFSTSSERERIEDNVFRNKLTFFAAAKVPLSFPAPDLPEVAFAGRSNVGKSSMLNSLTRQWGVARTSDKPGLTQTINFFKLASKLCLVDLPGYGFAYAKEEVKDAWEELVKEYVSTRVGLKQVCLLIDTKWGMKPRDRELVDLMERSQTKYQIVLTKTDLVFPIDVARRAMQIEESLKANKSLVQPVMMVSSKSGAGIRSLRTVLSKIARFAKI